MAHDPISTPAARAAEHLEPRYVFPEAEAAADAKLAALGKRPNVALIVFDDVGWGDFGCYGGGGGGGAPPPEHHPAPPAGEPPPSPSPGAPRPPAPAARGDPRP